MPSARSIEWRATVESLYRKHHRLLINKAWRSLRDRNRVVDLVQQVFTNLLASERNLSANGDAEKYLFAAFHNLLVDQVRRGSRWHYSPIDDVSPGRVSARPTQEEALVSERLKGRELPLPPAEKRIFEMAYFEKMKDREIADELKINIYTLQQSLVRSRRILLDILVEEKGMRREEARRLFSRKKR